MSQPEAQFPELHRAATATVPAARQTGSIRFSRMLFCPRRDDHTGQLAAGPDMHRFGKIRRRVQCAALYRNNGVVVRAIVPDTTATNCAEVAMRGQPTVGRPRPRSRLANDLERAALYVDRNAKGRAGLSPALGAVAYVERLRFRQNFVTNRPALTAAPQG